MPTSGRAALYAARPKRPADPLFVNRTRKATVSALVRGRRGQIRVELDGAPWRLLPEEAVVRAGLSVGLELDRSRLVTLARERRRARSLAEAGRALRFRDLSERQLGDRLRHRGVPPAARAETLARLRDLRVIDDARLAAARATALAERGLGNAAITADLERRGVPRELADEVIDELEPEAERARRIVTVLGHGPRAARQLARRGFSEDAVETAGAIDPFDG